ncbi:transmembrane signal receptor [Lithospermum erythrorhizon]|uniref:Receptor-like serine/threonine-protein kinase n=1 Tax=Lithospermum erythrorhizon TaxID=34254 RepID=A0AAV3QZF3_LITER
MEKLNEIRILFVTVWFIVIGILSCIEQTVATDTLTISQVVTFNTTLISVQNKFLLGFFSPGNPNKVFLGIWFNVSPIQYVWIANRENPLNDTSGVLRIGKDGNLVIEDSAERIIWSTVARGLKNLSSSDIVAQILDSGNLVLKENKDVNKIIWQSFDYPSHAIIPGMKIGWDSSTGLNRKLTSWKHAHDPSPGDYTFGFDLDGLPQLIIWKGDSESYRSGPWNGIDVGGITSQTKLPFALEYIVNSNEVSYHYRLYENSSILLATLSYLGVLELYQLDKTRNDWRMLLKMPLDSCGDYGFCGPNAVCTLSVSQLCVCLIGYTPVNQRDWDVGWWSGGCKRESSFNCSQMIQFKEYDDLKMPDFVQYKVNTSMTMDECRAECLKNCSCVAYANSDATRVRYGCLHWYGELMDVKRLSNAINQNLFVRVTAEQTGTNSKKKKKIVIIVAPIVSSILLLLVVSIFIIRRTSRKKGMQQHNQKTGDEENLELPSFDIVVVSKATQNFGDLNKIGEGGFGPVYKGKLPSGQEIAVKRLSENSDQGLNEFKNEVMLIAKLQHRNLVRLLGCCIHGQERMLIYEFMPNGSLDSYIFGNSSSLANSHLLVWRRQFAIILGIARGLLYLHRDSRLRIIHRDLKASNVLLDSEMNPKISDFGMARVFGEEQLSVKTRRVVGTFGYMAPEYVIDGVYSMKSDVFSFGVLVLEIVCGKKNNQFQHHDHDFNLLGHAWQLWLEGRTTELIDPKMEDSFPVSEVVRCIQVGLLCVQQRPEDRPTMPSVILMLDSESAMLPQPKRPGYYTERTIDCPDVPLDNKFSIVNDITHSMIHGR